MPMASVMKCDCISGPFVQGRMKNIISIISQYEWIIDAYVSDFHTKGFWDQLPTSLQNYFDNVEPPDLAWLLYSYDGQLKVCCSHRSILQVPPLSLLALRQCISSLALQRTAVDIEDRLSRETILNALCKKDDKTGGITETSQESSCTVMKKDGQKIAEQENIVAFPSSAPNYKNGQCIDMHHIFRKHVKPKKQHEINSLGKVISLVNQAVECSVVIDVGAGLGHLARLLAFQHGLHVMTIEAADSHAPKASEYDKDMQKSIHKARLKKRHQKASSVSQNSNEDTSNVQSTATSLLGKTGDEEDSHFVYKDSTAVSVVTGNASYSRVNASKSGLQSDSKSETGEDSSAESPSHLICTIQPDIAATQFLDILVNRGFSGTDSHQTENCDSNFVLASLHACGDLTPTLLRVFVNCPTAQGLASVACCYMKMSATTSPQSVGIDNFPMSSYLQNLPFHSLSYEAREMACHFADAYHQRLLENPVHLKIHSYRAALQHLIVTMDPGFRSGQVKLNSKKGANVTFAEYASDNLKKLGISVDFVPDDLMYKCTQLTHQWKRVVGFYTLRLSLAPLVETLLLCDRALFLLEHDIPSVLVPIFDPHISPRNFVLLALKS